MPWICYFGAKMRFFYRFLRDNYQNMANSFCSGVLFIDFGDFLNICIVKTTKYVNLVNDCGNISLFYGDLAAIFMCFTIIFC